MSKLPSSKQITKALKTNGFTFVSQRGSHAPRWCGFVIRTSAMG